MSPVISMSDNNGEEHADAHKNMSLSKAVSYCATQKINIEMRSNGFFQIIQCMCLCLIHFVTIQEGMTFLYIRKICEL